MADGERIIPVNIEEEMKSAYIDYSMSVIVSRALPDVRDGLKPVHRRVLYGMMDLGVYSNKAHKKSARIVGEVLGKYHPHGDSSVYDSMVRMAQPWSLRYPMVDGQGNFGSVDADSPAAMRYTEARLEKIAEEMLDDIEKETVDFQLNFDDSMEEPTVLPAKIPQLLVNGASGIAVGMATNMAPHNLTEVINATVAYIDNREIEIDGLMQYVKAPDFPTGGIIYGVDGVRQAYHEGRGRVVMRARYDIETTESGKEKIIVSEIPYLVNKAEMIEKTAALVNEKKIEGISAIWDESDRNGMRIVYDLKRDAITNVVLNNLFKHTSLQTSFSINNIALVKGRPQTLNLKDLISNFVEHRHDVVTRRTQYELKKAEERAHILQGLIIAIDNLDEVIKLIRASQNAEIAREGLMKTFELSELQARAILDMRLQKLTGLEREKLRAEYDELMKKIAHLKSILGDEGMRMDIIKSELAEILEKYGDERRTSIEFASADFRIEDMIPNERVVVTISHLGYMKRTQLNEYKTQNRGGRGSKGSSARNEDFLEQMFMASTHDYLLIFTKKGKCFWMRVFEVPEGGKGAKGRAIQNLVSIEPDDKVLTYINVKDLKDTEFLEQHFIMMCTKKGVIKKTSLEAYSRPRTNGINAINIREEDELLEAKLTTGSNYILMALKSGKAIHFPEDKVRSMGRTATGVRGVTLGGPDDEVIGMICVEHDGFPEEAEDAPIVEANEDEIVDIDSSVPTVLVVSEKGYGKRTAVDAYRITNRGGKGVKTLNITDKTGGLIAIKSVTDDDDLMIINKSGIVIRLEVSSLRVMGRATQGVRLINLKNSDEIAAVAKVEISAEERELLNSEDDIMENGEDGIQGEAPANDAPPAPESSNETEESED